MPERLKDKTSKRFYAYLPWVVLLLICLALQIADLQETLRYDRKLIQAGHYYLLLSGHLVHTGWQHAPINMVGLVLLALLFAPRFNPWQFIFVLFITGIIIDIGLWTFNPEIFRYRGLSGILHGLFIAGALYEVRLKPRYGIVLLVLLGLKLAWEQFFGAASLLGAITSEHIVVDAHLYGALGGLLAYVVWHTATTLRNIKA